MADDNQESPVIVDEEAHENGTDVEAADAAANGDRHKSRSRSFSRSSKSRSRSRSRRRSSGRSKRKHRRKSYSRSRTRSRSRRRSDSKPRRRSISKSRRHSRRRRTRSRSDSRSRSPSYSRDNRRRYRSPSPRYGGGGGRGGSRYAASIRDCPPPSRCLGVFGMNLNTSESTLAHYFQPYGKIDKIQIVYDAKTGRSRGFGFIYFDNVQDAVDAKEQAQGIDIDGNRIRTDFSLTQRPHTPTPGIYMGKPMERGYGRYGRSPSPYRRRSRSRSYS